MKFDKAAFNWYGLNHDQVRKHYGDLKGKLDYIGSFCTGNFYAPAAVYYAPNPDLSKGHKHFLLFFKDPALHTMYVTGMDEEQMKPFLETNGMHCPACDEVIYSVMRHDCRHCSCGKTMIDGGRDYMRRSEHGIPVIVNLLTGKAYEI